MNYRYILSNVGRILFTEGLLLLFPFVVSLIYGEQFWWTYLICAIGCLIIGGLSFLIKKGDKKIFSRDGFAMVALSWILMSLIGAIPPFISGEMPSYVDSLFDIISGFTTTGATVLPNVEILTNATHFWRAFSHLIGGMGVLVFVLAITPSQDTQSMHIMRAEMPGPTVGKLVSKARITARILYGIYLGINVLEISLLAIGGMPLFDSIVTSMATTGTGGFSVKAASIGAYDNLYFEIVITVFMILSAVNFNLYYFLLIGKAKDVFKNEELRWYLGIVGGSMIAIAINTISTYGSFFKALRYSSFQVASIISTTGFSTTDFDAWPTFSKVILIILMFIGACAGSTGGGIKVIRIVIAFKNWVSNLKKQIFPRSVSPVKFEGRIVDKNILDGINGFIYAYLTIFVVSVAVVSIDGFDFTTTFSSVVACFSNIGPGLGHVGPTGCYGDYSVLSKIILMFDMLAGRLEVFPMLLILIPRAWRKKV